MNTYEWLVDTLNKTLSYPINRIHELLRGYKEMMGSCSVDYVCLNVSNRLSTSFFKSSVVIP
ncbi:MAG: hypothetical protein IPI42_05475 [Saprospiraceae bacterium]|nr:hypothetical protein [Candidatus Parvibacillus calidus]MBX7179288.1 hypothetical protein [Saprospiraceae bacterium]